MSKRVRPQDGLPDQYPYQGDDIDGCRGIFNAIVITLVVAGICWWAFA